MIVCKFVIFRTIPLFICVDKNVLLDCTSTRDELLDPSIKGFGSRLPKSI